MFLASGPDRRRARCWWAKARSIRIVDSPDAVHLQALAEAELVKERHGHSSQSGIEEP